MAGGESGPGFRRMDDDWARTLRDQCVTAGVAFFFKQHSDTRNEMGKELRWQAVGEVSPSAGALPPDEPRQTPVALMRTMIGTSTDEEIIAAARLPADHVRRYRSNSATWDRVVQGDCREVMSRMPRGSVDAVVTDPPYGIRYGGEAWDTNLCWDGAFSDRHTGKDRSTLRALFGEKPPYVGFTYSWAQRAYDRLKPGGHVLAFSAARESTYTKIGLEVRGLRRRHARLLAPPIARRARALQPPAVAVRDRD